MEKKIHQELIIFFGLILLGSILRIYALDLYPAGFHGDEAWTGLEARRILKEGYIGFWSPAALGQTALPFYWTAFIFKLFGENIFSTRLSFSLLNIFSIPFYYLFSRMLFSKRAAIVATFFLVTSHIPLALSRRADYVAANFSFFPAIFFFLKALHSENKKKIYFALTGVFLGLSNHMYFAFWLTPILFGFFLLYYLIATITKQQKSLFTCLINLTVFFFSYLLIAFPMLLFAFKNQDLYFSRIRAVSIFSEQGINHVQSYLPNHPDSLGIFYHNLKSTLLLFNFRGDSDIWSNFNHQPVFDPLMGIFFLLGLIFGLYYLWKRQFIFTYLPFFFFLTGSLFTIDSPNLRRSQISIYLAYLFVALGMVRIYDLLSRRFPSLKRFLFVFGVIMILAIGFHNTFLYFTKYSISSETKYFLANRLVQTASFIRTLPQSTHVYFYSSCCSYRHQTLQFLLPDIPGEDRSREFGQYSLARNHQDKNVIYIFLEAYLNTLSQVELLYPGGEKTEYRDIEGKILFTTYFLKANP